MASASEGVAPKRLSAAERREMMKAGKRPDATSHQHHHHHEHHHGASLSEAHAKLSARVGSAKGSVRISSGAEKPVVGRTYRIKLCSSNWESKAGAYLDAHRSSKEDRRSSDSTFVLAHDCTKVRPRSAQPPAQR